MAHLTKQMIDRVQYEKTNDERQVLWDDEIRGFGLRVYPSGKKAFILSYRSEGRKRLMSLGYYGTLTLHEARKLAQLKLGGIKMSGIDPLADRQKAARGETMNELCEFYLQRHARVHKKSARDDIRRINQPCVPIKYWTHDAKV